MGSFFPVLLNVSGRLCVVVGGGDVAARKVGTLVERGAVVKVISPDAVDEIKDLVARDVIEWEQRGYRQGDLEGTFLCVAASDDPEVDMEVRHECYVRRVLANVVDAPEESDYQVPSFFEDGKLLIAVSTSGMSPAVARTLRRMIQSYLGSSFAEALEVINGFRERVKDEIGDARSRVRFWEEGVTSEVLDKVREGDLAGLKAMLEQALEKFKGR